MDPISIATIASLVTSTWKLLSPYAKKIGGKLAEKSAEALPEMTGKVWDVVKEKLETQPETKSLPADLVKAPEDPMVQGAFQYQLKKLLEKDEAFAQQLEKLVREAQKSSISTSVKMEGDGAVAIGDHAKAVGRGGVMIGGNVDGSNIVTGGRNVIKSDKKKKR